MPDPSPYANVRSCVGQARPRSRVCTHHSVNEWLRGYINSESRENILETSRDRNLKDRKNSPRGGWRGDYSRLSNCRSKDIGSYTWEILKCLFNYI